MIPTRHIAVLTRHPESPGGAVQAIEVDVRSTREGMIELCYRLTGDLSCLRIQFRGTSRRSDRLWEHTCFEAFVAAENGPAYFEFNFAPSGEWSVSRFRRYREPMPLASEIPDPGITVRRTEQDLELIARLDVDRLAEMQSSPHLRLALSAVIEQESGAFGYWALNHPTAKPDFHHRDAFAVEIPGTRGSVVNRSAMEKR